jgi:hypothetical protein
MDQSNVRWSAEARLDTFAMTSALRLSTNCSGSESIILMTVVYTRSTPSYKLLSEYYLLLTKRLTGYPLVLVGLSCGSSSFARVTNELPNCRTVVALRHGHLALLVGRLSSVAYLSLPTQLLGSKPAAYIDCGTQPGRQGKRERDCKHDHHYQCTLAWQGVGSRGEGYGIKGEGVPS